MKIAPHAVVAVLTLLALGLSTQAEPQTAGAAQQPKDKNCLTDCWTDAFIIGAQTQLRRPNEWRGLRWGVNVFPFTGTKPRLVEPAFNLTFFDLNPDRKAAEQPGVGIAVTVFRRFLFVGVGFSPLSDVHDKFYWFFGLSGAGIKNLIEHATPTPSPPPTTPPTPAPPSASPSATP